MNLAPLLLLLVQAAQSGADEKASGYINEAQKQFGVTRRCERNADPDEVVVCGRRNERERYRLPIRNQGFDKDGAVESVSRERHRLYEVGDSGIGSCSTVGPGGWTGCFHKWVKARREQRGE